MPRIVIADTSTLILFQKIGEFNLLQKVYDELITTPEIAKDFGVGLLFKQFLIKSIKISLKYS